MRHEKLRMEEPENEYRKENFQDDEENQFILVNFLFFLTDIFM